MYPVYIMYIEKLPAICVPMCAIDTHRKYIWLKFTFFHAHGVCKSGYLAVAIHDSFLWKIVRNASSPAIQIRVIPGKITLAIFPENCCFSFAALQDSDQTAALFMTKLFASSKKR